MAFKKVRCINANGTDMLLSKGRIYDVWIDIEKGTDHHGRLEDGGYVVNLRDFDPQSTWPYVWNKDRFESI